MTIQVPCAQFILSVVVVLASLGVLLFKKPVHSCLSFLLTLISLAALYLELSAPFIAAMQVLVYAGAILVIFMFVIVLFQDAHSQIVQFSPKSLKLLRVIAACTFTLVLSVITIEVAQLPFIAGSIPQGFGSVQQLGQALYVDFFFPFEAIAVLFLVSLVGALYIGKKVR